MKKVCIIGILILLTLIPISSAVDINTDVDNELYENPVTSPMNDDVEIISFFDGSCESINAKGIVFNEPIDIYTGDFAFYIKGIKEPVTGILHIFFNAFINYYVKASRFIGFVWEVQPDRLYRVVGIALGDIEWS